MKLLNTGITSVNSDAMNAQHIVQCMSNTQGLADRSFFRALQTCKRFIDTHGI